MQRYTYMRLISLEHYDTLFTREFSSDLLLVIVKTFNEAIISNTDIAFNNDVEQAFIVHVLGNASKTKSFDFVLSFLEEKELEVCKELVFKGIDKIKEEGCQQLKGLR